MSSSTGAQKQPYKYNGKELETGFDQNWYDYSARYYDGIRFTSIDPMAEKLYSWSPYVYCFNNPMRFVDVDGEFPTWSEVKHKAKTAVNSFASFTNGAARAMADNMVAGASTVRENGDYTDVGAYNLGQDFGDAMSMLLGVHEMSVGIQGAAGSALAIPESGGTAVAGVVLGAAVTAHGAVVTVSGAMNLLDQKGRVSEMSGKNSNSSSSQIPEYKKPKSGSGKEKASDIPDWAKGNRPYKKEDGKKFAKRLMDEKYGEGNYKTGPKTEYNQIKKWGDRAFE